MSRTIYILVPPLHYLLLFIHTTSPHIYTLSLHDALPIYLAHRDHADVEAVDPHDGLVALVVVVVPGPVRCRDEVPRAHRHRLALDHRVRALDALDDEADRRRGVAVRGRDLAGHDALHGHVNRVAHAVAHARDPHLHGAPPGLVHRHELGGLHQACADVVPLPDERGKRLPLTVVVPVAVEVALLQPRIESRDVGNGVDLDHWF